MKKVAIVQSSYIPWKGYFDLIHMVDEFILLDDVQYTRRDWRNRNRIKTANGLKWLSIPVHVKGKYHQTIKDTQISDRKWPRSHWEAIRQAYRSAPHFDDYAGVLEPLYLECDETLLSRVQSSLFERNLRHPRHYHPDLHGRWTTRWSKANLSAY